MNIFKLVGSIFVDNSAANKSIAKTDEQVEHMGKRFVSGVSAAAKWGVGVATAAGAMAVAVGASIVGVTASTREYRNEMGKLDTAFETNEHSSDAAKSTYKALQSVLGDTGQAVEASNHLALLAKNEQDLATWTDICTGVYGQFGASLPIEGLTESANETAKVGQITGSLADALNWAGISEDEFNAKLEQTNSEQERAKLIQEALIGIYGESAEAYKKNNAEVIAANQAQEKVNASMAKLGEIVEPVVTRGKELFAEFLDKLVPVAEYTTNTLLPSLSNFKTWVDENKTGLTLLGIGLGTVTTAIIAFTIATHASTIASTVATVATTAFGAAVAFLTSPITLIILAIGALIAVVYLLVTNWDTVKEVALNAWEAIKNTFAEVAAWFQDNVITPITEALTAAKEAVKNKFAEMKDAIANSQIGQAASTVFNTVKDGISHAVGAATDVVQDNLNRMKSAYEENGGGIKGIVAAWMEGVKGYWTAGFDFIDNLTGGKLGDIVSSFRGKLDEAKDVVFGAIERIKNFFNFSWSLPRLKLPHISISGGFSLSPLSVPSFGIDWYKKAMDDGMIMNQPTIFGFNSKTNQLMAGGEAGSETVVGTASLIDMIQSAVVARDNKLADNLEVLKEVIEYYLKAIIEVLGRDIILDGRKVGETVTNSVIDEITRKVANDRKVKG